MNKGKVVLVILSLVLTGCASNVSNKDSSVIEVKENSNSYCTNVGIKYKTWREVSYNDKKGKINDYKYYYEVPMKVSMDGYTLPEVTNEPVTMRIRSNARVEYVDNKKDIDTWLNIKQYAWIQDKGKKEWNKMVKNGVIENSKIKEEDVVNIKHIRMYAADGEYSGIKYDQDGYVIEFTDLNN